MLNIPSRSKPYMTCPGSLHKKNESGIPGTALKTTQSNKSKQQNLTPGMSYIHSNTYSQLSMTSLALVSNL